MLSTLRAARMLQQGKLIAHTTSTVSGVAASPFCPQAVQHLQRFKQRRATFILLADSIQTAMRYTRYLPPTLRRTMQQSWPGTTTLVVPGCPGLPRACYAGGRIALRVDNDPACRRLAGLCGGLMLSSSLNRRKQPLQSPSLRLRLRWHRYLDGISMDSANCQNNRSCVPSRLLLWKHGRFHTLRHVRAAN